jgi:GNAT superfamily N-acetyltransferase
LSRVEVRRLRVGDDCASAASLLICFFSEEGFETPEAVIRANTVRMVELEVCGLFLAEAEGMAIGVATLSLDFGIEFGWSGEMGDLYVLPEWRGRGVARALVRALEAFARDKGASGYQVTVTAFAQDAHDLQAYYRTLGFASEGRTIFFKAL